MSDDDEDFDVGEMGVPFENTFGLFDAQYNEIEPSEEVRIAINMMKAAQAIEEFSEYVDENDVDIQHALVDGSGTDEKALAAGFMVLSPTLTTMADAISDDDDDESPFKVGDGDDPIC